MSDQTVVSEREQKILGIIETARGKRAKFRDRQITMAHGAGGKATQTLIEGLFVPASFSIMPGLVQPDQLAAANGISTAATQLGQLFGPVLGGALVATAGSAPAFAVDAGTFAVSAFSFHVSAFI